MFRKFLRDYFTFSRTERNGLIVLVLIIAALIAARIVIPHIRKSVTYDFSEFQEEISEFEKSLGNSKISGGEDIPIEKGTEITYFDPNSATHEELEKTGLGQRVIKNIIKYREKGGRFRAKEDLNKIYGLDSSEYLRIEPYILIGIDSTNNIAQTESRLSDTGLSYIKIANKLPLPLNNSDSIDLTGINGIGPVLSSRIIKYRNLLGGYVSVDQLLEVYGMTPENYKAIRDFVFVDSSLISHINLNTTTAAQLSRHPYLNDYQARSIITYREIKGKFTDPEEIIRNNLVSDEVYKKIKPYLITE
jgi:competence ComEA-like helix-hairpin-helix protein